MSHAFHAREYKIAFGLMQGTPLVSKALSQRLREHALARKLVEIGKPGLTTWRESGRRVTRSTPMSAQEAPLRAALHKQDQAAKRAQAIEAGKRLRVSCAHCGKEIERPRNQVKERAYCSKSCSALAGGLGTKSNWKGRTHSEEARRKMRLAKQGPQVTMACPGCGEPFTRPFHRKATCCSRKCVSLHARSRAQHGTMPKYRHGCRCDDCTRANRDYHRLSRSGQLRVEAT